MNTRYQQDFAALEAAAQKASDKAKREASEANEFLIGPLETLILSARADAVKQERERVKPFMTSVALVMIGLCVVVFGLILMLLGPRW